MEFSYPVTVFTPTYNRAYILGDLYHSLQRQTCMDFEWLIVDDGSADDTKALVASWQGEENPFPIRYVYQENGGKCRAINRGLKEADGRLFFTVDSDDYLTDDAIEKVIRWEGELPRDGNFCGYVGNRGITPTQTPNRLFPGGYLDGTALLQRLADDRGHIVTYDAVCEAVWGADYYGYENSLNVHIRHLREKIEPDPGHPQWLLTVRGIGYRLTGEV